MINVKSKVSSKNSLNVDFEVMKSASLILRAMNHKIRQKILALIHEHGNLSVSEIYKKLKLEQSFTSSHLALLRKAGAVKTKREGQVIVYSINYSRITQIEKSSKSMLG